MLKSRIAAILIIMLLPVITFGQVTRKVVLQIQLDQPNGVVITPCKLRYNKDFAFSFTFDDGVDDTYTLAAKLFGGGYSPVDGVTYPGFYYSDGCGQQIPFTAGVSWYTLSSQGVDLHMGSGVSGYMSYNQSEELYNKNWDFFNHSYNHDANDPLIDYTWQWNQNQEVYFNQTGHDFRYFVPPSGDTNYIDPAFNLGAIAVFTSNQNYTGAGSGARVDDPIIGQRAVYSRNFIASGKYTLQELIENFNIWVSTINQNNHLWWNEFTHRVKHEEYGGSMKLDDFKAYMTYIADNYGVNGEDNGWFANSAQVYDYLLTRDYIKISSTLTEGYLQVTIDYSQVPWNLRYYDLSLILQSNGLVNNVSVISGNAGVRYRKTDPGYLINLGISQGLFSNVAENDYPNGSNQLLLYPNPTSGQVYFKPASLQESTLKYELINAQSGQVVANGPEFIHNGHLVDLRMMGLPAGIYVLVETTSRGQIRYGKIIYNPDYH